MTTAAALTLTPFGAVSLQTDTVHVDQIAQLFHCLGETQLGGAGMTSATPEQKQSQNRTGLCKAEMEMCSTLQARTRDSHRQGSPQGAALTPPRGETFVSPCLPPALPESSNVYTAWLASALAAEALAGCHVRPRWGSPCSSDEAFSCLSTIPGLAARSWS